MTQKDSRTIIHVEFLSDGRCTVSVNGEHLRAAPTDKRAQTSAEYRCAILAPPQGHPIQLSVLLPPGDMPSGAEFPQLAWAERGGHWIGSASLPAAPAFVHIPMRGSPAARHAHLLDWAALAATALAAAWTIVYSTRNAVH